ncbi:MAG: hypothetical protein M5T61_04260 [Acidimicrobiia bacterium]|nr:hypothetical protein [Acidimicrobiia bacterium]
MVAYGEALLEADIDRVGAVEGLGLDETLFFRRAGGAPSSGAPRSLMSEATGGWRS